jgi:hypothetical protein
MRLTQLINENVRPFVLPALISKDGFDRIAAVTDLLKDSDTFHFGFETELDSADAVADLGVCFADGNCGSDALQRTITAMTAEAGTNVATGAIERCLAEWRVFAPLKGLSVHSWLEFDLIESKAIAAFQPSFFFELEPSLVRALGEMNDKFVLISAQALLGDQNAELTEKVMKDVKSSLPHEARIFEIGAMLSRTPISLRIGIRGLKNEQIGMLLQSIHWPGNCEAVTTLARDLGNWVNPIDLGLGFDCCSGLIEPRVGLECYFSPLEEDPRAKQKWKSLGEYVVKRGLSLAAKYDALGFFPGLVYAGRRLPGKKVASPPRTHGVLDIYELSVYHIKFSLGPSGTRVKAYLSALKR